MKTASLCVLWLMAVSAVWLGVAAPASAAEGEPAYWALAFENDTPKQLALEDVGGKLRFYWYLVYRVKNPESKPLPARLRLTLRLGLEKQVRDLDDTFDRLAEAHIEKKVLERPVCNWAELRAEPLKPGETREGLAMFAVGNESPDFDKMTLSVHGLAELRPIGRVGNVRKFRERVLLLKYEYVSSRWRAGKELKYLPEEWSLDDVAVTDRATTDAEDSGKLGKKLEELLKKAKEERERKVIEEPPKPDNKSSTGGALKTPLAAGGPVSGRPAPELLKALRDVAPACIRASFTETIGRDERRQTAAGTLALAKDGKFAVERNLNAGSGKGLKEQRVFDGQTLWVKTAAAGVGDTVRRWTVAGTKKEWHTADGKPEVDFATVSNPVRAWRLFGDDLIYLGTERLASESAYILEIHPDKKLDAVIGGPLTGELLGKAAGRRLRFWIGAASGFQLRMCVYDERGQAIGELECTDVKLESSIPAETFAFKPPAGGEVIDMNAAIAENSAPKPPAAQ